MLSVHQILSGFWAIQYEYALNYLPVITPWLKGERPVFAASEEPNRTDIQHEGVRFATLQSGSYTVSDYGDPNSPEKAPKNSIAIVTISGVITKHDQACGPAGMNTKANVLQRCYANDNITGIVIDVESGGGASNAMFMMNEVIGNRNKPVIGFANDMAASAAYGILSACDMAIANSELAQVGSVGTIATIMDYSEQLKQQGINLIEVYASQSTDKNGWWREAMKGNLKPLQAEVDMWNGHFLSMVQKNRGEKLTNDTWNTGKMFMAPDAKKIGLIDEIDSFANILNYFNT